ncbi:NAD(P)-binding domain-containing protein [Streptomyces atriruber]|uniref:NAD(P)-binding domain-containing protein n=1 Tax=Streptomyces atriruber TaxID=545121 RepID=UPI0006E36F24|nr:NAD(P)-binding domain-containing protein [Streptomyces atriruber]
MSKTVVVIGAGPYGLSAAAHLRARGIPVRIFGAPVASWARRMPAGMLLRTPPAATELATPREGFTLQDYCRDAGERRLDTHDQVPVGLFLRYGRWFRDRLVPRVEDERVAAVDRGADGFRVKLSSGEVLRAGAVVVATGLTGFAHLPAPLAAAASGGPSALGLISHSSQQTDPSSFAGRSVTVVGAGQSALESAALLHEAGADVQVVARGARVRFDAPPSSGPHWRPETPAGRSWAMYGLTRQPAAFRRLPAAARLRFAERALRPAGAWWLKERFEGRVPVLAQQQITAAQTHGGGVTLRTTTPDGRTHTVESEHVLAATGYRVQLEALEFLSPELRADLMRIGGFPVLDKGFSSSVPGLYFTGPSAVATYGPAMRLVSGTRFAGPRLTKSVAACCDE